jgi:spore germination cell wall hydrolase CwlJ-like protein
MMTIMSRINQDLLTSTIAMMLKFLGFALIMSVLVQVVQSKFDSLREGSEAYRQGFVSTADRTRQLDCLTRNIYWEAASEPFEGKVAVAQVTMNRVASGRFGEGVCGVVYQQNNYFGKIVCQFSWVCEATHKIRPIYPALYRESEEVAKKVLLENFGLSTMRDALYFHGDYVSPNWGKKKISQIGRHIFYKD